MLLARRSGIGNSGLRDNTRKIVFDARSKWMHTSILLNRGTVSKMSFKGISSSTYEKRAERQKSLEPSFKLVMIGDSGVGKSCLLEKLLDLTSTNSFISTIGVDVRTHVVNINGRAFKLQVWDTGGQQRFRPILVSCYRNVHGILLVYDVTSAKTFNNLPQWIKEVDEYAPRGVPRLLVGNKADLADRREVAEDDAKAFAADHGMVYIETSAIVTKNICEAFAALVKASSFSDAEGARSEN